MTEVQGTEEDEVRSQAEQTSYPKPDFHLAEWKVRPDQLPVLSTLDGPCRSSTHKRKRVKTDEEQIAESQTPSQSSRKEGLNSPDFFRKAIWAPDGAVILANTESQQSHVLRPERTGLDPRKNISLEHIRCYQSPSPLLDAVWYPLPAISLSKEEGDEDGRSLASNTWCFVESHRDLPIRLTDSLQGTNRGNYSIMNHVEKFVAPQCLAFSPDLCRLYCGLRSELAIFPLSTPGLNTHSRLPLTSTSKRGQKGIVSALAVIQDPSDTGRDLIAVGTFSGTVGIYSVSPAGLPPPTNHTINVRQQETCKDIAESSCLAGWKEVEGEGITQLKFHPLSPHILFVSSRKSDNIYVYDLRYLFGNTARWSFRPLPRPARHVKSGASLAVLPRAGSGSQQRLSFDIDWAGRMLISGDQNGSIHIWKIDGDRFVDQEDELDTVKLQMEPFLRWQAHQDAVGSVSIHPYEPWVLTVSGARHWPEVDREDRGIDDAVSSCSSSDEENDATSENKGVGRRGDTARQDEGSFKESWRSIDNSLKIWDFSLPDST